MAPWPGPADSRDWGEHLLLEVTAGPAAGRTIQTDQELVIGREGDGAGRIEDDIRLARRHARISRDRNDQVMIEDLESGDGVYINGVRIDEQPLTIGDVIQLGETSLELRLDQSEVSESASGDASRLARASAVLTVGSMFARTGNALRDEFLVSKCVAYLDAGSDGRFRGGRSTKRIGVVQQGRSSDENQATALDRRGWALAPPP